MSKNRNNPENRQSHPKQEEAVHTVPRQSISAAFDPNHAICAVKKLPISDDDEFVKSIAVGSMIQEEIENVKNQLEQWPEDDFIAIGNNILLPTNPDTRFLVMDVFKIQMDIHNSYWRYSQCEDSCREKLPSDYLWALSGLNELKYFLGTTRGIKFLEKHAGGYLDGFTIGGQKTPTMYYSMNDYSKKNYNGYEHDDVGDIYTAKVPQNKNALQWVLEDRNFQMNTEYKNLALFYRIGLIELTAQEKSGPIKPTMQERKYTAAVNQQTYNKIVGQIVRGEIQNLGNLTFSESEVRKRIADSMQKITEEKEKQIVDRLLELDTIRADMTPYVPRIMEDPNGGLWDLWEGETKNQQYADAAKTYYARDPRLDIQEDGIIGIDFGTKSTVVVCKEGNEVTRPLRIGMGRYEKAPTASDYENPTVMQFCDIDTFRRDYNATAGRPLTKWSDICISHTAFGAWKENENTEDYFSFFNDLKQWAGDPKRRVRIRDQKGTEIDLSPYENLKDGDFDPIEIYAYYIGLYINNMHTKHIYLKYLLSFPVTYTKSVREKILSSFKKGLAQSFPETIRNDPSYMERFQVQEGAGEPAAYAVCALQEYRLIPASDEKIVYGVFDFGGGTTDFDFGVWRKASGPKERRYRYVIHHFGDGGDSYLGGENLLELLAFEVFKANRDTLRKAHIAFPLPPQCQHFGGDEMLISDSQEAWTNMRQMMECLRPFWERRDGYEKLFDAGVMKLRLFDSGGNKLENFELAVDVKMLDSKLRKRIEQGVDKFFNALFSLVRGKHGDELKSINSVHIFLAGNSSKSEILREIFRDKCEEYSTEFRNEVGDLDDNVEYFKIYPPLGTKEADELIGISEQNDITRPTGKTGVAIGLVQCSKNSSIKVINDKSAEIDSEIKFKFWVGFYDDDSDEYFKHYLNRNSAYQKWVEYLDAGVNEFDLFYTSDPSAEIPKHLLMESATVKKRILSFPESAVDEDAMVYLRPVSPNEIEFVVAASQADADAGNYTFGPTKIMLE